MSGFEATQLGSWQLISFPAMIIEGLYFTQTECIGLSWLPDFDKVSGGVCILFSFATMCVTSGILTGISGIMIGLDEARKRRRLNNENYRSSHIYSGTNTLDYNHYGTLTLWHETMANYGLEAGIEDTPSAVYYTNRGNLFAANATSWVTGISGNKLYVQHGLSASRSYVYLNSASDIFPEEEAMNNQDGLLGYEIQCCHASGKDSSSGHSDWEAVNALAKYLRNDSQATDTHAWRLLFSDLEYQKTLITGVANAEEKEVDMNEEWNERELCQNISQHNGKCIVKPFKNTI